MKAMIATHRIAVAYLPVLLGCSSTFFSLEKKKEAKKKIRYGGESPAGGKGEKGSQRAPPTAA
jgi:hypothetical protein